MYLPFLQTPTLSDHVPPVTHSSGDSPNKEYVASHITSTNVPTETALVDKDPSVGGVRGTQSGKNVQTHAFMRLPFILLDFQTR